MSKQTSTVTWSDRVTDPRTGFRVIERVERIPPQTAASGRRTAWVIRRTWSITPDGKVWEYVTEEKTSTAERQEPVGTGERIAFCRACSAVVTATGDRPVCPECGRRVR